MHIADLNLAGLATIAALALFFPGIGLIEHRRRAVASRQSAQVQKRQLERLVLEEASRIVEERERQRA